VYRILRNSVSLGFRVVVEFIDAEWIGIVREQKPQQVFDERVIPDIMPFDHVLLCKDNFENRVIPHL
jgi:hypothetical protein